MSVTAAGGFAAAAVHAGVKAGGALDLAVVAAERPVPAAAVFTVNQAAAAPVVLSREHMRGSPQARVVVANAGCANAGTGPQGAAAAVAMAEAASEAAGCDLRDVLVASTGPIGPQLPVADVVAGIRGAWPQLAEDGEAARRAALAILTTDSVPKEVAVSRNGFTVGGMVKGSGMIRPDMATMLCFLTTDAVASADALDAALRRAVDASFHSLTIDGCASTNDTVTLLASGASGVEPAGSDLEAAVTEVCVEMSRLMAGDAEGASRVVTLNVTGAVDATTARAAGRAMADSALVRASFYGGDPNWGRLLGAMGATDLTFDPGSFAVAYNGVQVAVNGSGVAYDVARLLDDLVAGDLVVDVRIGPGPGAASVLTTDLTPDYVVFNSERS